MAVYDFQCHACGERDTRYASMKDGPPAGPCPACGSEEIYQDFRGVQFSVFKPYVDEHTTGQPVLLETAAQRDAFHQANGVTIEKTKYVRKPIIKPSDHTSADDVMQYLAEHGPVKEEKVQLDALPTQYV